MRTLVMGLALVALTACGADEGKATMEGPGATGGAAGASGSGSGAGSGGASGAGASAGASGSGGVMATACLAPASVACSATITEGGMVKGVPGWRLCEDGVLGECSPRARCVKPAAAPCDGGVQRCGDDGFLGACVADGGAGAAGA